MKRQGVSLRAAGSLSIFLAVALFALMALLTVVLGAGVYRSVVSRADESHAARTAVAYVTGKVRSVEDTDRIRLEKTEVGNDMLVLPQCIDGDWYETRIYAHEGTLYEVFCAAEIAFAPQDGQEIVALEGFSAVRSAGNLLRLRIVINGREITAHVALGE